MFGNQQPVIGLVSKDKLNVVTGWEKQFPDLATTPCFLLANSFLYSTGQTHRSAPTIPYIYPLIFLNETIHCFFLFTLSFSLSYAQTDTATARRWADSVFNSLTDDQRIAQLMVIRTSTIKDGQAFFFDAQVDSLMTQYNVGAVCLFQGTPGAAGSTD